MADVNPATPDELTMRLVDEAARMLDADGPGGLSLRRLATAAGTSTMAVYTRFGDKPRLLAAMHREGFRRLGERLAAAHPDHTAAPPTSPPTSPPDATPAPLAVLVALGRAYRAAALASPHLYGLMFGRPPAQLDPAAEDAVAAEATYLPLVAAVRAAVDAGALTGAADVVARHLWTVVHGAVSLELAGLLPADDDPDAAFDLALAFAAAPFLPG